MRLCRIAAALVLSVPLFAVDPGLLSLVPPSTQVLAGASIDKLVPSPFGQYLIARSEGQDFQKIIDTTGFDPRRDLREILFAGTAASNTSPLILARGTFDIPRILEAAQADGEIVQDYKGVTLIKQPGNDVLAFFNGTLAVSGSRAEVEAAVGRQSAPSVLTPELASLVSQVGSEQALWFAALLQGTHWAISAPQSGSPEPPVLALLLQNVQHASGGVTLGSNVVLTAQIESHTAEQAAMLGQAINSSDLFIKDVYMPFASLLHQLIVTSEGNVTKLSLTMPEAQLEQFLMFAAGPTGAPVK